MMYLMPLLGPLNPIQVVSTVRGWLNATVRRIRPDHRAIQTVAVRFPGSSMMRFYLYAAAAPSRRAARPFDDAQVRRAADFAQDVFPGVFGRRPSQADEESTIFSVSLDGRAVERALHVHRSGLVEVLWALDAVGAESSEIVLDTGEVVNVVARLVVAIGRRSYAEISNAGRGRRKFARVDWRFNLTGDVMTPTGDVSWNRLQFSVPEPPRAEHQRAAVTMAGYGLDRLRNQRRAASPTKIARVLLTELLAANGYYDFAPAMDASIAAGQDVRQLPAPARALETRLSDPSEAQVRVLNSIFDHFVREGQRVRYPVLDKELDLEGLVLRELAESMPGGLMLPVVQSRGGFFRDDDELLVTRRMSRRA